MSPWGFESIFLNFQALDFGVEGLCRHAEFSCRTRGPRNSALAFCQRCFNHFLLLPHEGEIEHTFVAVTTDGKLDTLVEQLNGEQCKGKGS